MKPGILVIRREDGEARAELSPSGWRSDRPELARYLNLAHPAVSHPAGPFWSWCFAAAVRDTFAEVEQAPEIDRGETPEGVVF